MIYVIKELLYINVYDPFISLVQIFQCLFYGIMATSSWSETITKLTEYFLINVYNRLSNSSLLYHSLQNRRDSQWSLFSIILWNINSAYWLWHIGSVSN